MRQQNHSMNTQYSIHHRSTHDNHVTDHSPRRESEVSCAPHPADASAHRPESVTPPSCPASTTSTHKGITTQPKLAPTASNSLHTAHRTSIKHIHSPSRVRVVNCAPHPADARAQSPESVTLFFNPASTHTTKTGISSVQQHAINISLHIHNNNMTRSTQTSLTVESERCQLYPTSCRYKYTQSRVSHSFLQPCIHTTHSGITQEEKHALTISIRLHTSTRAEVNKITHQKE